MGNAASKGAQKAAGSASSAVKQSKPKGVTESISSTLKSTGTTSQSQPQPQAQHKGADHVKTSSVPREPAKRKMTQAELDEELKSKLSGIAGDGGEAGVEYEDGVPVAMKRGVKNNMFRYI